MSGKRGLRIKGHVSCSCFGYTVVRVCHHGEWFMVKGLWFGVWRFKAGGLGVEVSGLRFGY